MDMSPREVSWGCCFGVRPDVAPLRWVPHRRDLTPLRALEQAVLPALLHPPCIVSFSGGRDSSGVLAVATAVARREALALPVPVSLRFAQDPDSLESEWQELVVTHLGLPDWERVDLIDEVDVVGPYAQAVLRRHGLVFPHNAHFHLPILERGAGGSLLTGIGGDELFAPWPRRRMTRVLGRRDRPRPRDVATIGLALAPQVLRAAVYRSRAPAELRLPWPWLHEGNQRALVTAAARSQAAEPIGWDESVLRLWWPDRARLLNATSLALLAADAGVAAGSAIPLQDPTFLTATTRAKGREGFESRTMAMRELFGSLLPDQVLSRRTKARFASAFWNHHSRAFVARWDGSGLDEPLVDPQALRTEWSRSEPDARTQLLLQRLWLATEGQPR